MPSPDDRPTITICGLGPGASDLVNERTIAVLSRPDPVFVRTTRHPAIDRLPNAAVSFDPVYDAAPSFASVYDTIAHTVRDAAKANGRATYCVPGSPLVLERSVAQLRSLDDVAVEVVPAISFLDEVWARLAVDPVDEGVRLIDGHRFGVEAAGQRGPLLVAHAHAQWVLSDIKLALLDEAEGPEDTVVVLQRLGTNDERIFEVSVSDLDRAVEADHLTSLYLPEVRSPVAGALAGSVELMRRLRDECPWDRSQDHSSLRRFLVEEAYEVLDVLDRIAVLDDQGETEGGQSADDARADAFDELEGELGDLWFQVLFHSRLATEAGYFDIADVARTLTDKMIARHPHVFGTENPGLHSRPTEASASSATMSTIEGQWEELKAAERGSSSSLDGIPAAMPALARAAKIIKRIEAEHGQPSAGPWLQELERTVVERGDTPDIGALLLAVVRLARNHGVDAEQSLREATNVLAAATRRHESEAPTADGPPLSWVIG